MNGIPMWIFLQFFSHSTNVISGKIKNSYHSSQFFTLPLDFGLKQVNSYGPKLNFWIKFGPKYNFLNELIYQLIVS